jgi:uncharacterized protein YkwD
MRAAAVVSLLLLLAVPVLGAPSRGEVEARVLELVNAERQKVGLAPLAVDRRLARAARTHTDDMLKFDYFSHDSPRNGSVEDRIKRTGLPWTAIGENIASFDGWPLDEVAEQTVVDWMHSPPHRKNILDPGYDVAGVGVGAQERRICVTMDYARTADPPHPLQGGSPP